MSEVLHEVKLALQELLPEAGFKVLRSNPDPAARNRSGVGPYVPRTVIVSYLLGTLDGTVWNQTTLRRFVKDVLEASTIQHSITHVRFEERATEMMRNQVQLAARDELLHFERGDIIKVIEEHGDHVGRVTIGKALDTRRFPGYSSFFVLDAQNVKHAFNLNFARTEVVYPVELMR